MLITTYAGLVVNSDYIAYVALKRCETTANRDEPTAPIPEAEALHKVLLCLSGGDHIVAATELSPSVAQQLRQEIAHCWGAGATTFDVNSALQRLCEGRTTTGLTKGED